MRWEIFSLNIFESILQDGTNRCSILTYAWDNYAHFFKSFPSKKLI